MFNRDLGRLELNVVERSNRHPVTRGGAAYGVTNGETAQLKKHTNYQSVALRRTGK